MPPRGHPRRLGIHRGLLGVLARGLSGVPAPRPPVASDDCRQNHLAPGFRGAAANERERGRVEKGVGEEPASRRLTWRRGHA